MKLSAFSCVHLFNTFIASRNRLEYRMLHEADECSAQAKASASGDGHSHNHSHPHNHSHSHSHAHPHEHDSDAPSNQTSTSTSSPPCPSSSYEAHTAAFYATRPPAEPSAYEPLGADQSSDALSLSLQMSGSFSVSSHMLSIYRTRKQLFTWKLILYLIWGSTIWLSLSSNYFLVSVYQYVIIYISIRSDKLFLLENSIFFSHCKGSHY